MEDKKRHAAGPTAIVLAAGESKRMGKENKLLVSLHGSPLIAHVVAAVSAAHVEECIVVLGHEARRVEAALAGYPVRFVHNAAYESGMGTSIRAGVTAAAPAARGFMICLSDMPLITTAEYNAIADAFVSRHAIDDKTIVAPVYDSQRGNPVVLSSAYRERMGSLAGDAGCKNIIREHAGYVYLLPMDTDHILCDVDTIKRLAKVRKRF